MMSATGDALERAQYERIRGAIAHAILAPSSHNTQPWLFGINSGEVELFADYGRRCPVVDPKDRELHISCGAALYQLRLAMNCDGLATLVKVLPPVQIPGLLARVLVAGAHQATEEEHMLLAAIPKRRTNRFPFEFRDVDPELQAEWINDVKTEGVWIRLVRGQQDKHAIADLVSEADHLQASDRNFRMELSKWVHRNQSPSRDGMPGHAHGVGDLASNFSSLFIRTFDWGNGKSAKDRQLAEGSPLLAVLGTDDDTPAQWIACGQALAKMLLRATSWSVDASFLNQPIEISQLRYKLASLVDTEGHPQLLLRLGYGQKVKPTPRRTIEEVIVRK